MSEGLPIQSVEIKFLRGKRSAFRCASQSAGVARHHGRPSELSRKASAEIQKQLDQERAIIKEAGSLALKIIGWPKHTGIDDRNGIGHAQRRARPLPKPVGSATMIAKPLEAANVGQNES
jgi:hypothetical protein